MANKARNTSGKFARKSDTPRKIRSVNLTDEAWQWLAEVAAKSGVSRNDYLEAMAEGGIPVIKTVNSEISPLMETVETEIKGDSAHTTQHPDNKVHPFMETVKADDANTAKQSNDEVFQLWKRCKLNVASLRKELAEAHADREELEAQLSELKQNSAPAATLSEKLTPDAATMLSKLRAKRKKSKVELADVEALLELLD
ncbi:hypothetical protein [Microcoleus sp. B3-D7]|uniref:hypothetical protein n=1 Tax=Microcoleus sp. B3-D7 TaxID=2818659 RepID=UPI002FCE906E